MFHLGKNHTRKRNTKHSNRNFNSNRSTTEFEPQNEQKAKRNESGISVIAFFFFFSSSQIHCVRIHFVVGIFFFVLSQVETETCLHFFLEDAFVFLRTLFVSKQYKEEKRKVQRMAPIECGHMLFFFVVLGRYFEK